MVIALVTCLACGAAYFFRKRGPSSADVLSPASHMAGGSETDRRGLSRPAPQSHLLGEIQTLNQSTGGGDLAPVAPAGVSGTSPATPMDPFTAGRLSVGHAALRTPGEASSIAGRSDNQSFAPPAGAPQGFGVSAFSGSAAGGAPSEVIRHKVADGDTLTGLAERYLGNGNRFIEIYELNRDALASPDLLPIGVELKIPARGLVAPPSTAEDPQPMVPLAPAG
jgi:nucleoid-associated protein YgaU